MGQWNELVERFMFGPDRLAPELPPGAETPASAFPGYFISPEIPVAPAGWALKVGGMVVRPATLSLEQLQQMPRADLRVRHHCVEGWSAVASWHGVRLRDLAEVVGADPRAGYVEFRSFDSGYWSSWDRESALHPQTILAYGMNGEPLAPDHGAPIARVLRGEARIQDGEVPHRGELPSGAEWRVLGEPGLRVVRRDIACDGTRPSGPSAGRAPRGWSPRPRRTPRRRRSSSRPSSAPSRPSS